MRTRTRNVVKRRIYRPLAQRLFTSIGCNGVASGTPSNLGAYTVDVITSATEETISDSLGKSGSHACQHKKMTYEINEDSFYTKAPYYHSGAGVVSYLAGGQELTSPGSARSVTGPFLTWTQPLPYGWTTSSLTSSDESRLKEDAIEKAKGLKADVLLNVIEANQIWPSIKSITTALPVMARNWKEIRKVIRTASGGYLAYKFGISPILGDLMNIHRYMPRMRNDVKRHMDQKASRFSAKGQLVARFEVPPDVFTFNGIKTEERTYQGVAMQSPVVRYVLVTKPNQKYSTELFATMDLFMKRFATSPASLAWEKIPFSFVLDWFVDLRGVLRGLDKLVGFEPFKVVSFTRSLSYHLNSSAFWAYRSPCSGATLFDVRAGSVEYKYYERSLVSMDASAPTWTPRFGKSQAGISAALIAQMLTKAK